MHKLDLYWMSQKEWWEFKEHIPVVSESAPQKAKESYIRYQEQRHKCNDIFLLNPGTNFEVNCDKLIQEYKYQVILADDINKRWIYQRENATVEIAKCEDFIGPYFVVNCDGISGEILRKSITRCPECDSDKIQVSILFGWRNEWTERLYEEGRLDYVPGAYDRHGTWPPTHKCLECGCKWHNGASMYYWSRVRGQGLELTPEVLWE